MLQYSDFTGLVNKVINEGGFSINVNTGAIPGAGYMVSIPGAEEIRNIASFNYKDVKSYIARHAEQLANPGAYLGAWMDGSEVYLDISINVQSLFTALQLARDNKQLAIYDISSGESIYLAEVLRAENLAEAAIR